jgi:hypothetical protein
MEMVKNPVWVLTVALIVDGSRTLPDDHGTQLLSGVLLRRSEQQFIL